MPRFGHFKSTAWDSPLMDYARVWGEHLWASWKYFHLRSAYLPPGMIITQSLQHRIEPFRKCEDLERFRASGSPGSSCAILSKWLCICCRHFTSWWLTESMMRRRVAPFLVNYSLGELRRWPPSKLRGVLDYPFACKIMAKPRSLPATLASL